MRGWIGSIGRSAAACCLCFVSWISAAPRYTLTDLGHLSDGPNESYASGINALGQVTGTSGAHFGANGYHAYLWNPATPNGTTGQMFDLGYLPGGQNSSGGGAINTFGQVTGIGYAGGIDYSVYDLRAFLWTPTSPNQTTGFMMDLGARPEGFGNSRGRAINSYGQVIGDSNDAFLWTPGTPNGPYGSMVGLGALPGGNAHNTAVDGINDSGQVTGTSDTATAVHAFVWTPSSPNGTSGAMADLGDLPGGNDFSQGFAINNRGQVTGYSFSSAGERAFLWTPNGPNGTDGSMMDLGVPGGSVFTRGMALNSSGDVVGEAYNGGRFSAFLWTPQEGMLDLWSLTDSTRINWTFTKATGINDAGQIIGYGVYTRDYLTPSVTHGFLLTPVPEPAGAFAIALLTSVFLVRPRRG